MVRKRKEDVAEIRGYIPTRCKLGLSVKSRHDEIIIGINKCHFLQLIGGLQNLVPVRNQSKVPLIQEDPGRQLPNLTLIRSSSLLRKMFVSLSDSWHK